MEIEKIACYIRVSTQEQKLHGISLDAQRDALKRYAKKHGLKIVAWYEDEGVSGRKLIRNRPALQRMLNDAQAGLFDRIIFIKLDRFFRSIAEYHECMKLIEPVIWTATEEKYDLSTANGRAFVNMKLTIAELEADQTGERIDLVNEYKVKTGQALTGAHCQGIAFTVKNIDGFKRVVRDPDTEDMVLDYVAHFRTYHNKRQALLYIRDKYNTNVSYNSMEKVLLDTKMYGHYRGNDDYCEKYYSKDVYEEIQDILKKNIKNTPAKRVFLFSGLIMCPLCKRKMAGKYGGGKKTLKRPSGKIYVYDREYYNYRCSHAYKDKDCSFLKQPLESILEAALLDNFDKYVTDHIKAVKIEDARVKDSHASEKIVAIKGEMTRVKNMYRKGDMTEAEYDKDMAELKARLNELESRLKPLENRDLTIYKNLLESDWKELYNALTKENKRAFWRKYLKGITLKKDGTLQQPIFF